MFSEEAIRRAVAQVNEPQSTDHSVIVAMHRQGGYSEYKDNPTSPLTKARPLTASELAHCEAVMKARSRASAATAATVGVGAYAVGDFSSRGAISIAGFAAAATWGLGKWVAKEVDGYWVD